MALRGEFTPPGDKSVCHRVALASILADGEMSVTGFSDCDDVKSSLSVFRNLGGDARGSGSRLTLVGLGGRPRTNPEEVTELDCGNSGTTMRLLSGILAGIPGRYLLDGDQQLRRRPMERLADPLRQMGARIETTDGRAPLNIKGGPLHGIDYVNNDASAQLKGAVILATLSAESPSRIIEPFTTRDHTERLITVLGGRAALNGPAIEVFPSRLTLPQEMVIAGDPSAAAFFLIGAALMPGSEVTARNILLSNTRIGFLRVLDRMGASVSIFMEQEKPEPNGHATVKHSGELTATEVTQEEIPSLIDEIPMLALAAASAKGVTAFRRVRELRLKETDRLTAIKHQLGALGIDVRVENDDLFVKGPTREIIMPETLDSGHDHRLAMTLHMALALAGRRVPVLGDESVRASYPEFQADLARLNAGGAEA